MKKPTNAQKKELKAFLKKWRPLLFLDQWDFELCYMDRDDGGVAIETSMKSEYSAACWSVYPCYFNQTKDRREEIVVHELCHSVVVPLQHLLCIQNKGQFVSPGHRDFVDEQVTQHVTNIIMGLNKL